MIRWHVEELTPQGWVRVQPGSGEAKTAYTDSAEDGVYITLARAQVEAHNQGRVAKRRVVVLGADHA